MAEKVEINTEEIREFREEISNLAEQVAAYNKVNWGNSAASGFVSWGIPIIGIVTALVGASQIYMLNKQDTLVDKVHKLELALISDRGTLDVRLDSLENSVNQKIDELNRNLGEAPAQLQQLQVNLQEEVSKLSGLNANLNYFLSRLQSLENSISALNQNLRKFSALSETTVNIFRLYLQDSSDKLIAEAQGLNDFIKSIQTQEEQNRFIDKINEIMEMVLTLQNDIQSIIDSLQE